LPDSRPTNSYDLLPIGNGQAPGMMTAFGAIVEVAGLAVVIALRLTALRFTAGLRRATFLFFAAFFFPDRLFAFAIQSSSRSPARRAPARQ
jgi:hypothetical protein